MRKLFLSLVVVVLLCGVTSFAQTTDAEGRIEINSREEFLKIGTTTGYPMNGNYIQTANIDLGTFENAKAIIPYNSTSANQGNYIFQGTYDGDKYTISYQASFAGTQGSGNYALFNQVSGTIKNLNVNANITLSGNANSMNVALICGNLLESGIIEYCNALGNVNSTVNPSSGGGSDAGLIVGESAGTVKYCTGSGNVVGVGYAGGLIGQMTNNAIVLACSFTGSVTANAPSGGLSDIFLGAASGNFAGGICGSASNNSNISFCTVDGSVNRSKTNDGDAEGIICSPNYSSENGGGADVANCYGSGTVDGSTIDADNDLADNNGTIGALYYEGESNPEAIVAALNAANTDPNFYFAVVNGHVVLIIGQRSCNAPTNLRVNISGSTANIAWDAPQGATQFLVTYGGGVVIPEDGQLTTETVNNTTFAIHAIQGGNSYRVSVQTICGDDFYSDPVSISFTRECPVISGLAANNITHETATATWTSSESTTFTVRLYEGNNINSTLKYTTNITEPQSQASINLSDLEPATQYTIEVLASCGNGTIEGNHATVTFTTKPVNFETVKTGNFNDHNTWAGGIAPEGNVANIKINQGHRVTVTHDLVITGTYKITENKGALQITQQGQLINETDDNVPGIVEIVSTQKTQNKWTFVGAPFETGYKLGAVMPVSGSDVAMVKYDYLQGKWSNDWAHVGTSMKAAEGTFAWPFYEGVITFSTYDLGRTGTTYPDNADPDYALNNGNVEVSETVVNSANGYWMALSNPYPAKLSVSKFLAANTFANSSVTTPSIQGEGVYIFNGTSFDYKNSGDILMTEGFFVNFNANAEKKVVFTKSQMTDYPATGNKSSANELIELTLQNGDDKVRVYFAHNEDAEQGYDIFDANKMFATTGVAEPYFVTDGIALIKEEVAELPYYATMNVRSQEDTVMNFVLTNLPEGYAVSIIDGEEVIDLVEGGIYSTEILTGENADRFKVLVKKNVGIADVEELDVTITNNNRQVNITADKAVRTEVYNILGQKVFETNNTTFVLDNVASGAYVVKVYGASASKTQKIVVE